MVMIYNLLLTIFLWYERCANITYLYLYSALVEERDRDAAVHDP
jgi:hypothetical protein